MPDPPYLFRLYHGSEFRGAGVLVSSRHVLTCAHVVKTSRRLVARGGQLEAAGKVIARSPEEKLDLALLELDTHCGEPPPWSHQISAGNLVTLCGFPDQVLRTVEVQVTPHLEGDWVVHLEVPAGVPLGMSGGAAIRLAGLELRCVGLIQKGGATALKSLLAGPGNLARFLAEHNLRLPGCPAFTPGQPVDEDAGTRRRYCKELFDRTGQIDIRGFQRSDGKATAFPIEQLYITLQNHQGNSIESLLRERPRLVVQGHAGSGKSTFLQHLAHQMARGGESFPLLVRVVELDRTIQKELAQPRTPASEEDPRWLAVHLAASGLGLDEPFVLRQLQRPQTVVLLDGLDEALNEPRRRILARLFTRAAETCKCRFVLTTRPGAYESDARAQGFAVDTIASLKPEAVAAFFANWSRCVYPGNPEAAEKLRADLERQAEAKEEVRAMASDSPMMLTALASIHWNEGRMPEDRAELYQSVIGWMARQRENRPGRMNEKKCRQVLGALALGMQTWPQGRLKQAARDDALKILADNARLDLRESREFLEQEQLDSGIVVGRDAVEFRHLTFQEYLAALEVLESRSELQQEKILLAGRQRYSVEWREFLRLLALLARPEKAQRLYGILLDGAGQSLADRARTVALIRLMAADRRENEAQIEDRRYLQFVHRMTGLFEGQADGRGLDIWSRAQAAEAWELLVQDRSRLRLPRDQDYWVRVNKRFEIGRSPVTVYEYECYLTDRPDVEKPPFWAAQSRFPLRPVVAVSCNDAEAYCAWCSARTGEVVRLPEETEWYLAAAGEPPRLYPWGGEDPNHDRANFGFVVRSVTPVGLFPAGATPDTGILDMAGNVSEWTSTPAARHSENRVLRGGSFFDVARYLRAANRDDLGPGERLDSFGFRCVREVFP